MNYGFIYCLGNPSMPNVYKIGMTDRAPSQRCWELSGSTAAAMPFDLLIYGEVPDARQVEGALHRELANWRINPSREFFSLALNGILERFRQYASDLCVTSIGEENLRLDGLRRNFLMADTDEERVSGIIAWARAYGVRMCQKDGNVSMAGNIHTPEFFSVYTACFAMKSILLQHLPHDMPQSPMERILKSVETKAELSE